jgi:predicted  nucleic acid-binding Zn ribbon protein
LYIFKLHITGKNVGTEEFFEISNYYFEVLYQSTQITNEEWQYEPIEGGLKVNLICPEADSFKTEKSVTHANRWRAKLETELGCKFEFKYIGLDPERGETLIPSNSRFLILKFGPFSPLLDGDTYKPVPLYKIPSTYHDGEGYNNINFWENNYQRVKGLWFNGCVDEKWMQDQLQEHDSDLNKQGIECSKKIEEVTQLPTYYFLFNYRELNEKDDKLRKCPGCGGDWLIEGKTSDDFYGFKCDPCRLISELSSNTL